MQLETLQNCPVCDAASFSNYLNVEDYTVSHREFTIQQCNACYFLFTNPRPTEDTIGEFYQSQDYISHHDESKNLLSKVYNSVRNYTVNQKVALIQRLVPSKGKLLDIGCGTGTFIQAAKNDGWQVAGTEPDQDARTAAFNKVGNLVYSSPDVNQVDDELYNIITMWHVLEHVHELNAMVSWLARHLKKDGKIIIAVPNPQSYDAQKYGRFWAALDVPRHLYHFTKASMHKLATKHNLAIVDTLPMWFDSFYVGMLSTKYKGRKTDLIDSFRTGLLSNIKGRAAKHDGLNTSSLIYIITKK